MIIFDFNQVAISNLMEQIGSSKTPVDESLVRHMILNTIRTYVKKFKNTYGPEVIIACDNKKYFFVIPEKILIDKEFIGNKKEKNNMFLKFVVKETLHKNSSWLQPYMFDYENIDKERLLDILNLLV